MIKWFIILYDSYILNTKSSYNLIFQWLELIQFHINFISILIIYFFSKLGFYQFIQTKRYLKTVKSIFS